MSKLDLAPTDPGSFSFGGGDRSSFFSGLPRPSLDVGAPAFWASEFEVGKSNSIEHSVASSDASRPSFDVLSATSSAGSDRDRRWADVRRLSLQFQKLLPDSVPASDISKNVFYELYNTAVSLVRAVDGLDPDRQHPVARGSEVRSTGLDPFCPRLTRLCAKDLQSTSCRWWRLLLTAKRTCLCNSRPRLAGSPLHGLIPPCLIFAGRASCGSSSRPRPGPDSCADWIVVGCTGTDTC